MLQAPRLDSVMRRLPLGSLEYAHLEAGAFLLACLLIGAGIGIIRQLSRGF